MSNAGDDKLAEAYLAAARHCLEQGLAKIEHCLSQLDDDEVWWRPNDVQNSIANLILHLCGNLRQWIVAGVGGEDDLRERAKEFSERGPIAKEKLLRHLKKTIAECDAVLSRATADELLQPRRIQGFDETALSAIFDSVSHFRGHVQEIIHMTRFQLGDEYQFFWSPSTAEEGAAE